MKIIASEKILLQHYFINFRIDFYFPKHKLGHKGDEDKNID